MKKALAITLAGAMALGGLGAKAHAGDREWAVAGKVLAGLAVLDAVASPRCSSTVVYGRRPMVWHPPVVHRTVVHHPPVVRHRPAVPYHRPVVHRRPTVRCRPSYGPIYRRRHIYRAGYRRGFRHGYRVGYRDGACGWR
ncbi:MAG: hypothetical protein ACLF0G_17125 [Candidatus Brocadiia bacterium]